MNAKQANNIYPAGFKPTASQTDALDHYVTRYTDISFSKPISIRFLYISQTRDHIK